MRLSIGGLEVQPSVWRKAFEEGGYDSDAGEDRAAGVALGYVAQVRSWGAAASAVMGSCTRGWGKRPSTLSDIRSHPPPHPAPPHKHTPTRRL